MPLSRTCRIAPLWLALLAHLCVAAGCVPLRKHRAVDRPAAAAPAGTRRLPPVQHSLAAFDQELRDPLALSDRASWSPFTTLRVRAQTVFREAGDDVLGLLNSSQRRAWDEWAAAHVHDGDIVFLQGANNKVLGVIDFSRLTREVTASDFTHVAVAAVEDGRVYLYDIDQPGPGRVRFGSVAAAPHVKAVAIKRLRPDRRHAIGPAVDYCRRVYESKMPFDNQLKLGNDRLYCAELVELAFRSGGQVLSAPVRWDELPGIDDHPFSVGLIRSVNGTQMDERVVLPGNQLCGLWSCPDLELVVGLTPTTSPPIW